MNVKKRDRKDIKNYLEIIENDMKTVDGRVRNNRSDDSKYVGGMMMKMI